MKPAIALCIVFLLSIPISLALGMYSSGDRSIDFEPNTEKTFYFGLTGMSTEAELFVDGEFSEYMTVSRKTIQPDDPDKKFSVHVKFPETLSPPGHHLVWVGARDISREGMIGTAVDIRKYIKVNILYPGRFIEASITDFYVSGNTAYFNILVKNFGRELIPSAQARINIYDTDDNLIGTTQTDSRIIPSDGESIIKAEFNTTNLKVGDYKVIAIVTGDGRETELQGVIRVGSLQVDIIDFTRTFFIDTINKFDVTVESTWSNPIEDAFVEVKVAGQSLKSSSFNLQPFEQKNATLFFDTTGIALGTYDAEFIVHFSDKKSLRLGKINVIEPETRLSFSRNFLIILAIVVALIVVIVDIIIVKRSRKHQELP